jgi:hypothetical protein
VTTFVPNTEAYIVNRPARQATFAGVDASGERLLETRWSYDGADGDDAWQQAPSAGLSTGLSRWSSSTDRFVATRTEYGRKFASAVWRDNVYATQFHPEKSQANGLRLLRNFVEIAEG